MVFFLQATYTVDFLKPVFYIIEILRMLLQAHQAYLNHCRRPNHVLYNTSRPTQIASRASLVESHLDGGHQQSAKFDSTPDIASLSIDVLITGRRYSAWWMAMEPFLLHANYQQAPVTQSDASPSPKAI